MTNKTFIPRLKGFFQERSLYPFLLGLFFVLFQLKEAFILYSTAYVLLFIAMVMLLSAIPFAFLYIFFKNKKKPAIASLLAMITFLFFDNIRYALYQVCFLPYGRVKYLMVLILILLLLPLLLTKSNLKQINSYLNVLLIILVLFELANLGKNYMDSRSWIGYLKQDENIFESPVDTTGEKKYPDIYHIVLDAYTSSAELKTHWNYDNGKLDSNLSRLGFYSASKAKSNSTATQMSLAMTFNMDYLPNLDSIVGNDVVSTSAYRLAIKNNQVTSRLEEYGYNIINLSIFDIGDKEKFHQMHYMPDATSLPQFLFRDCFIKWPGNQKAPKFDGQTNLNLFSALEKTASAPHNKPIFVYAHLMMPHGPYYFDANGKMYPDGLGPVRSKYEAASNYIEQLIHTNTLVMHAVEKILASSKNPPIIIIHGDHGSRLLRETGNHTEEYSILARFYFPDQHYMGLYDSITPVNFYRVIFNCYFGEKLPILLDRQLYGVKDSH